MTVEQKSRIAALRNSGKSYAEIAKELGLGKITVSNFCLRNPEASRPARQHQRGRFAESGLQPECRSV